MEQQDEPDQARVGTRRPGLDQDRLSGSAVLPKGPDHGFDRIVRGEVSDEPDNIHVASRGNRPVGLPLAQLALDLGIPDHERPDVVALYLVKKPGLVVDRGQPFRPELPENEGESAQQQRP